MESLRPLVHSIRRCLFRSLHARRVERVSSGRHLFQTVEYHGVAASCNSMDELLSCSHPLSSSIRSSRSISFCLRENQGWLVLVRSPLLEHWWMFPSNSANMAPGNQALLVKSSLVVDPTLLAPRYETVSTELMRRIPWADVVACRGKGCPLLIEDMIQRC